MTSLKQIASKDNGLLTRLINLILNFVQNYGIL